MAGCQIFVRWEGRAGDHSTPFWQLISVCWCVLCSARHTIYNNTHTSLTQISKEIKHFNSTITMHRCLQMMQYLIQGLLECTL